MTFCEIDMAEKFLTSQIYGGIHTKENGIPVLSQRMINTIAERIVRELMPQNFEKQPDATDLRKLFTILEGWHYAGKFLSKSGNLLGLTSFQGGEFILTDVTRKSSERFMMPPNTILVERVLYNADLEHIFRFTFAHEIGHALFHRRFCMVPDHMKAYSEQGSAEAIQDTKERFQRTNSERLQTERDWLEWQANAFASAVLMPESLIKEVGRRVLPSAAADLASLNELLVTVSDVFKVSLTASWYRLKELGYIAEGLQLIHGIIMP